MNILLLTFFNSYLTAIVDIKLDVISRIHIAIGGDGIGGISLVLIGFAALITLKKDRER